MKKRGVGLLSSLLLFVVLDSLLGILIPDSVLNVLFAATMTVVLVGLVLVVYGTFARNRWGINFHQVNCPHCSAPSRKSVSRNHAIKDSGVDGIARSVVASWTSGAIQSLPQRSLLGPLRVSHRQLGTWQFIGLLPSSRQTGSFISAPI